jgi:prevent-host-death family protein
MNQKVVMASRFKQQCLRLLDQVASTRVPLLITKRGKPVALVVPVPEEKEGTPTMGSVTLVAPDDEAYFGTGEEWEAESALAGP